MAQPARKYDLALSASDPRSGMEVGNTNFPDEWYLMTYQVASSGAGRSNRKKMIAAAVGVCFCAALLTCWLGFQRQSQAARQDVPTVELSTSAAAVESTARGSTARVSMPERPVEKAQRTKAVASPEELSRLKTRNRRLEALIKVLRQRTPDKKIPADLTAYPGQ